MSLTYTDIFCGAGGSSIGLSEAGMELKLAANHWARAIETHSTNFPQAEHLCADVSNYPMRSLPRTDVLWASPICTEISPAGGRRRISSDIPLDLEIEGHVPKAGLERTRATFWDVIRAAEVHRYRAVIVENVVEAAWHWVLFDEWVRCMRKLGYTEQIVCVSSAHIGDESNLPAPQWRDRLYVVLTAKGVPVPDVRPRPVAHCLGCGELVRSVQWWKRADRPAIGKYGTQYQYRCPNQGCHRVVEPLVRPAASIIDWADPGRRIGDRARPLAAATMRRIQVGLDTFAGPFYVKNYGSTAEAIYRSYSIADPLGSVTTCDSHSLVAPGFVTATNHDGIRHLDPSREPLPSRTARIGEGVVAFTGELRRNARMTPAHATPAQTITANGNHHFLATLPGFISKHHGGQDYHPIGHMNKPVTEPLAGVVARPNLSLVVPYRRGTATTTREPLAICDSAGPDAMDVDIEDCYFRMLKPREHLRAQRFPDSYVVLGNKSEQTMQAGNAVSSNVAHWIGSQLVAVLGGAV